jgi:class 3 adenylate cyclase
MLSALFTEFDQVCLRYNNYKLYTIGDCYCALGFVDARDRNPPLEASNIVSMALEMVEIIREVREQVNFADLDMRIGIHTVRNNESL